MIQRSTKLLHFAGFISLIAFQTAFSGTNRPHNSQIKQSRDALVRYMRGGESADLPEKCGLPAISFAMQNRDRLTDELKSDLQTVLARPSLQKSILVGNFRIHYDTVGTDTPAMLDSLYQRISGSADQFADSVGSIANYCLDYETRVLGYPPPPPDSGDGGGTEFDIYIVDRGDYGETTPETELTNKGDGGKYTSFVSIDNDFQFVQPTINKGMPALRVTLAHELYHSIQMGNYGYWYSIPFFYEIASVWMEDVVFTDVNDYLLYVNSREGHFFYPEVPFNSNEFIMYSRGIWAHYLSKRFGRDVIRRMWEEIPAVQPLTAMDNALSKAPYVSSFKSAFAEWTSWNYFTGVRSDSVAYYPEGKSYPEIKRASVDYMSPASTVGGTLGAISSRYYLISSQGHSLPLVLTNINLDAAVAGDNTQFSYAIVMNQVRPDNSSSPSSLGFYLHLNVSDPSNWFSRILTEAISTADPFPNPFRANGFNEINFPVASQLAVTGTLSIFSSDMKLVYSAELTSAILPLLTEQAFRWNGRSNSNEPAGSGIYIYFLQLPGQSMKGKFVLLRK